MPDQKLDSPSTATRSLSWVLVFTHFVVLFTMIGLLFTHNSKTWHRSFFIDNHDPMDADSVRAGFFPATITDKIGNTTKMEWLADTCGPIQTETTKLTKLWVGDKENAMHVIGQRQRDMCRFQRVGRVWMHSSDPRALHMLSSASPAFLAVSVQVVVAASMLATSSFVKTTFSQGINAKWTRSKVFMPVDQIAAIMLLVTWFVLAFVLQTRFVIVYNNLVVLGIITMMTITDIVIWSWRKTSRETDTTDVYRTSASGLGSGTDDENGNNFNSRVSIRMPLMRVPMVPYDDERVETFQTSDASVLHTVHRTFDVLWRAHVFVMPRLIMASSLLPVLMASAMYYCGSIWLYNDIFYMSLVVFITTAVAVPLYAVARICVMSVHESNHKSPLTWYVVLLHLILTHIGFIVYMAIQLFGMVFSNETSDSQPGNSLKMAQTTAIMCIVYNSVVLVAILGLVMSPRNGDPGTAFASVAWIVEVMVTVCITIPALLMVV